MTQWPNYGRIDGPVVMIGFGSIGRGTLPLIERHFEFDKSRFVVIGPDGIPTARCSTSGALSFVKAGGHARKLSRTARQVSQERPRTGVLRQPLRRHLLARPDAILRARLGALYIDTVVEPWPGFYFDKGKGNEARTNYALRETVLAERRAKPRRDDRRLLLRRQSRHGELVRQTGPRQSRSRPRRHRAGAHQPRAMGTSRAAARRQGRPHRRARHPARQEPEAARRVRQYLVG